MTPPIDLIGSRSQTTGDSVRQGEPTDELRRTLQSTPARIIALGVLLSVLLIVSVVVSADMVSTRKATHDRLLSTTEPLANAAQNLYSVLSVADAAAVTGFISGGIEPESVRDRYIQAIGETSDHLVAAAAGLAAGDRPSTRNVTEIARMLPVYTGLIETARTNNRIGNPVGAAYLSEASHLMQSSLLPAAQELHTAGVENVESTQRAAVAPPWQAIALLLVTVAALAAGHVVVSRKSRRTFNPGLILAIAATGLSLGWLLVAGLVSSSATQRAIEQGAEPLASLTESRILAQQSRTAETLLLARRDATGAYDGAFAETMTRLGELLDRYTRDGVEVATEPVAQAVAAREAWINAHARTVAALDRGDYTAAAVLATGPGPDEATAQFAALDQALGEGIDETRAELRDNEFRASRTLSGLEPMLWTLLGLSLVSLWGGLIPRLREYR
ncbi:hypothetical protein [Rhodococcus chondri]|uniref:Chemotaxis methyl-accepting receptor HlyB-like 4HB MCP domain-containing protein n=1 Tax=Rhodococcus chondri TaxID=3065941 RepID=A0ABU7JMA9_9NOCA|nr:hypothetical protein [Rhodococcus sp. CC-R104]MEE2030999.1 hypothetical protein [Rhodococcus sp. CC-R104]